MDRVNEAVKVGRIAVIVVTPGSDAVKTESYNAVAMNSNLEVTVSKNPFYGYTEAFIFYRGGIATEQQLWEIVQAFKKDTETGLKKVIDLFHDRPKIKIEVY
ncbi:MAG: hypothetical protein QXM03_12400 [Metallosphaera sp.]|uniref:hypothetical protein n=1 Tax=Metallosphaera sp. TaxID=2020860 RepID=UPI00315F7B95